MRGPEIRNTHPYVPDSSTTWPTTPPCTCGFPKVWRGHAEPDIDPEAAVIDARILGETQETAAEGESS